jgi:hypothetical protein
MKWYRWTANLIISVIAIVGSGNVLAANVFHTLNLGEPETYSHVLDAGAFTDTGSFSLDAVTNVNVSIIDTEVEGVLDVSSFSIRGSAGVIDTFTDLTSTVFSLGSLGVGVYSLTFEGIAIGSLGATYDVTVNSVPLPAAAWLFGMALIGFTAFSARRSV